MTKSKISRLITTLTIVCASIFGVVQVNASEQSVFNDETITEMSEVYNVSKKYVEDQTSYSNLKEKTKLLNDLEGEKIIENKNGLEITTVKKEMFLDKDKKIPMGIVTINQKTNVEPRYTEGPRTYHSYYYVGVAALNQYVQYTERVHNINRFEMKVNDVYATYTGIGSAGVDNNGSYGVFSFNPWARSVISGTCQGYGQANVRAYSSGNMWGVWNTEWAFV